MLVWIIVIAFLACSITLSSVKKTREEVITFFSWIVFAMLLLISTIWYGTSFYNYIRTEKFIKSDEISLNLSVIQGQIDAAVIGDLSNGTIGNALINKFDDFLNRVRRINYNITAAKISNESILLNGLYYDWPEYPPLLPTNKIIAKIEELKKEVNNMEGAVIFKAP